MSRMKALLAVAVGLLVAVLGATPAQAHNSFTGSNPKDGARLAQAPKTVTLRFLATLDIITTKVEVSGPGGVPATAGKPEFTGNRVSVGVLPGAAGEYTVSYQVASGDGHPIKGRIRFTVTTAAPAPSGTPSAPGAVTSATAVVSATPASPVTTTSATALVPVADRSDDPSWWPWLLGGAALIAAGLGVVLIRRRRTT